MRRPYLHSLRLPRFLSPRTVRGRLIALIVSTLILSSVAYTASSAGALEKFFGESGGSLSHSEAAPARDRVLDNIGVPPVVSAAEATVTTDKIDYVPESIVHISGSGWQPGEIVALTIIETDGDPPWNSSALADADGNISNSDFVIQTHDIGGRGR
jgi:hypothetical protein